MKICGIIAEYNPFHSGHDYHIRETRRILGENTAIVCVMSGNYVQRGDAAMMEKYQRARAAARCGADLVIEMPLSAVLSSAAGFAWGGVQLLDRLGFVDYISFGSECGNLESLSETAHLLKSDALTPHLRSSLRSGLSYAAAQQLALQSISPHHASLLANANNTLGIEYISALQALKSSIQPITVRRDGAAHDSEKLETNRHPSASALRHLVFAGKSSDCLPYLPANSAEELYTALNTGNAPVSLTRVESALLSHLRRFSVEEILKYTSGDDGLANRLFQAIRKEYSYDNICLAAQTRCYPLARIRRALLRMFLELDDTFVPEALYARVLAIGPFGRQILRLAEKADIPFIIKPTSERNLPCEMQEFLRKDEIADDLYALMFPNKTFHIAGERYRKTPFVSPKVLLDFPTV